MSEIDDYEAAAYRELKKRADTDAITQYERETREILNEIRDFVRELAAERVRELAAERKARQRTNTTAPYPGWIRDQIEKVYR